MDFASQERTTIMSNAMMTQKLLNLERMSAINIAVNEGRVYLVFQDGRKNYGYRVKDLEYANKVLKTIERDDPKWWRVLGEPVEVYFKKGQEE